MDTDLLLVAGVVLLALTLPAIVSALTDGRPPRLAALVVMIGGTMVAIALSSRPGGYSFAEMPDVITRVVARFL